MFRCVTHCLMLMRKRYSFVVKSQDTLRALQVVHTNVLRIPLQSEKEGSMIKGEASLAAEVCG